MKKAVIVVVLILFTVGAVFAGGQAEEEQKEKSETKEEKVSLSFSSWLNMEGASKKTIQEMIDRYQQKYPNVEVELIGIPFEQTQQQIFVAVSGGNAPDVMHLVAQWGPPLASMGTLEDLHDYYSDAELNDIPKAAYEAGLFQDQLATVPWQLGSIVVFAWKSVLEEAGLPTSSVPETWSEFKQQVAKISNLGDDIYGFGGRTSKSTNSAFWFFPVMWGHGGEFEDAEGNVVFNNPGTVEALQWYKELGEKEYTPVGMGVREVRNIQAQGKVGHIFDGPWMRGIYRSITGMGEAADDEYVLGKFPKAADGKRYGIGNNHVLAVAKQSDAKQAAIDLIKYFTQDPSITKFYYEKNGAIPTYKKLLADPLYANDPFAQVFVESAEFADSVPSKNPSFSAALEFVANAMQSALLGGDPAEAAEDAEKSIKTLYKQ